MKLKNFQILLLTSLIALLVIPYGRKIISVGGYYRSADYISDTKDIITVTVAGEVKKPGDHILNKNSRVYDAVIAAGGAKDSADVKALSLNKKVSNGEKIIVPTLNAPRDRENFKININTADKGELMLLPAIGESTAKNIIKYREDYGNFEKITDITRVKGIGEKNFNKFKDYIKVKEQPNENIDSR